MHNKVWCVLFAAFWINNIAAIPKPDDDLNNEPLLNHNSPLEIDSKKQKHYDGDKHNLQYDLEAFLGEDGLNEFGNLTPDESRRRLGVLITRIDKDANDFVELSELKNWIEFVQHRYMQEHTSKVWAQYDTNGSLMSWETYRQYNFGFLDSLTMEEMESEQNGVSYQHLLKRDRRRWGIADKNADDNLDRKEFMAFLHPEENPDMQEIVLTETIEDIDKNKDGKISIDEYIGDMFSRGDTDDEEPDWVLKEREIFIEYRDTDHDGFMDREETRNWVVPKDYKHSEAEAKHLLLEADKDNDGKLARDEILDAYNIFVGSQATSYGDDLNRHDEF